MAVAFSIFAYVRNALSGRARGDGVFRVCTRYLLYAAYRARTLMLYRPPSRDELGGGLLFACGCYIHNNHGSMAQFNYLRLYNILNVFSTWCLCD